MSDTSKVAANITTDQAEKVGGGECTAQDYFTLINNLTNAYEGLVDFTSHVIERVVG